MIVNFITNAIRYTPNKEDIIISTIDEKNRIKVCIENKGTHIEEEQLDKIWDRFYRVDAARQRSQGGTGLGLAISKNILELHEVEYGVKNTEDGVLFYFYLLKKSVDNMIYAFFNLFSYYLYLIFIFNQYNLFRK